ncbi:type II secretion system F family protein, partial [Plesiomonas shigelloides]
MDRIATHREKMEALKSKIKKALFYPAMVMLVAIGVS